MKCPKCSYVSHDYLDACRKCGVDLVSFKKDMGLLVLQPGMLDLGLVLGEAGGDDLFESMGEDITMHAGNDDDFEISLDEDSAPPEAQHAHVEVPRAGAREAAGGSTGLDHLTLELDVSTLSGALAALPATPAPPGTPSTPSTPAAPPPAFPGGGMLGHMTLDIEPDSGSIALPSSALAALTSIPPPGVPETAAPEDVLAAADLDVSLDSAALAAAIDPAERSEMVESLDAEHAAGVDAGASAAEVAGATASVPLPDIVLAEAPPVGLEEQEPESIDPTIPVFELLDVDVAVESSAAERGAAPPEVEETVNATLDSVVPTVDDALLVSQTDEPSGSDLAAVVEPDLSPVEAPSAEEVSLWPGFETALMDLAMPTLDDAVLALTEENMPPPQPSHALTAVAEEATPEDTLTLADLAALGDVGESTLSTDLTLDLSPPDTGPDQGLTTSDALPLEALDDPTLPGHLTLDLDVSGLMADWSSAPMDDVQRDDPPGARQAETSPPQDQAGDAEELTLDLDDVEFDDDTKA